MMNEGGVEATFKWSTYDLSSGASEASKDKAGTYRARLLQPGY
jgi:hypothetical protein